MEFLVSPSTVTVEYSDIQSGESGVYVDSGCTLNWDAGNIDADPMFVDPNGPDGIIGTEDDNLRLSMDSPCIDSGDNDAVPVDVTTDLDGNPRIVDGDCNDLDTVDMGAYEFDFGFYGDCSGDCFINLVDYAIFAGHLGDWPCDEGNDWCGRADIDRKDGVGLEDLFIMAANWLAGH
jgi:hypothetical protein